MIRSYQTNTALKWLVLPLMLTICACQSLPKIHILTDKGTNVSQFKTFAFHPELERTGDEYETLTERYLKTAISRELQLKGFKLSETPDLWVNFNVHVTEKLLVRTQPVFGHYYDYRYGYRVWPGYPVYEDRIQQYTEGTLNIDLVYRLENQLIWEGVAVGKVTKGTMDNLQLKIDEAVTLIFEQFP